MSDLDTEIRDALVRVTSSVDGTGAPTFEHLVGRRRRRRRNRAAVGAFAAVLLIGLAGVGLSLVPRTGDDLSVAAEGSEPDDESTIEDDDDSPDLAPAPGGESLLIWLEVDVPQTEVWVIAETLRSLPEVMAVRFVDREETWREFSEFYADEPEIIEFVEPDQLPTLFVVTTGNPTAVAEAVESLPGVSDVEFDDRDPGDRAPEDRVPEGLDEEPASQAFDPALLASAAGATTIVFGRTDDAVESWDNHLLVWQDGVTSRIGPFSHPWVSNGFLVDRVSDSGPTRIYDLDGQLVCEPRLPDQSNVHHVTATSDGTVVLGVEQDVVDEGEWRTEAFAYDCLTGERTPIEPFTVHSDDGEWVKNERIGDRVFELHGDAEGNIDPILNADGIDIVGDDWAGHLAWSADGSILAYGNHRGSASLHVTNQLVVRDTSTGQLLWETELPQVISFLVIIGDRLVVGTGEDRGGWVSTTERVAVYDLRLGQDALQVISGDEVPPGLIHLD